MWVYLQDRFVSEEKAVVSVFDRGFLYGDGLFETVRAYKGKIALLPQHLQRLTHAANRIALPIPPSDQLEALLYETLNRNRLRDTLLRLTITRGVPQPIDPFRKGQGGKAPGLPIHPTLVIFPRPCDYSNMLYKKGVIGQIVTIQRNAKGAQDPAFKSISFLNNVLARQEAASAFEAILLNHDGYLAEGSISNLFWVRDGRLYTPDLSVGILAGTRRALVIELAKENKIEVQEGCYRIGDFFHADEAFLTNTGFELMPLIQVNERKIGPGHPGLITRRLHDAFKRRIKQ